MTRIERIKETLLLNLKSLSHIDIVDESHKHRASPIQETHIKLLIVSLQFESQSIITRHRLINTLLASEFHNGLHALSLHLYTPDEWQARGQELIASPVCRGRRNEQ